MIRLPCPWCGPRNVAEFGYVGEATPRPDPVTATARQWRAYLYDRANPCGWTSETWYHRMGCRRYIRVERHTLTNEVRPAGGSAPRTPPRSSVGPSAARSRGTPECAEGRSAQSADSGVLAMPMRLDPRTGEVVDRTRTFTFRWNGREVPAYGGDTIASALAAAGERVFSRSLKYHRPRGLLTASFHDPGCIVQVDDEPNVRGAHRLIRPGNDVRSQNTWPSLRFDVKAVNQLAGRFLPAGFYYKTFIKPRALWPAYESVLKRFSNGGEISPDAPHDYFDKRYAHPDVLVAGGGPAGMAAALGAAEAGASVLLVEEEHALGGHLRWGDDADLAALDELSRRVAADAGIEVLCDSAVLGRYDDNWIAVVQRTVPSAGPEPHERLVKARAGALVVAAGLIERPYVFAGNDLPGIMLSTAVRRLVNLYAVKPGERAVVLTANDDGDAAVADLKRAGVEVAHVADARLGEDIMRAHGRGRLRCVELPDRRKIECDLLVTAIGWTAPAALLTMAGDRPVYDPRAARFFPDPARLPDTVLATGGLAGDGDLDAMVDHATATGAEAARRSAGTRPAPIPALPRRPHPALFHGPTHGIVDYCEDVSSKDIVAAVKEGYDSAELVKRYTTATMGPTQGKLEVVNTVAIVAEATGRPIEQTGTTTWRPPHVPVSLGALAGRVFEPVRYSPMQPWHEANGAQPLVAGAWIRPDHYGDPAAEVRTVREAVGVIDVTPIGKLDLRGPDVPELLNLLYVNKWSKLAEGRVRYGVMCAEDGVVLDDGVTGHLGPDHYLMSTTSSGAAMVWEWVESWLQTEHPDWQVHVTPLTTAYASMNVAGPRSRVLLERLTEGVDLGGEAFPYMNVRTGRIAGVDDCVLWRIGFTGELSYELHVPAAYGLHVWEALMEGGRDLGVGPFGVEAQRVLRLEKGHLIVGQDTDGLTRGYSAGLDWAIKLDKDDFVGKPELAWQREAGGYPHLVGLQPLDGSMLPEEASQLLEGGSDEGWRIVGRVTSSRTSPTLRRSICLAQVAAHLAAPGTRVIVRLPDGRHIPARVTEHHAHVDPDGVRLNGPPPDVCHAGAPFAAQVVADAPEIPGKLGNPRGKDAPTARSPIARAEPVAVEAGWQVSARRSAAETTITDLTPLAKVKVEAPWDGRAAAGLGVPFGRAARDEHGSLVIGSGPGEWLVLSAPGTAAETVVRIQRLAAEAAGRGCADATDAAGGAGSELVTVLDLTHGRALVRVTGDRTADLLAKVCGVDLADHVTPHGAAFRSSVARLATDVVRDDRHDGTRSYLLHCERSSGQYLHDALLDAGAEYGIDVDGFQPPGI